MGQEDHSKVAQSAADHGNHGTVDVKVNGTKVTLGQHRVTGLDIKDAAVAQRVPHVTVEFTLMRVNKDDSLTTIPNGELITVTKKSEFKMVAADDNSQV